MHWPELEFFGAWENIDTINRKIKDAKIDHYVWRGLIVFSSHSRENEHSLLWNYTSRELTFVNIFTWPPKINYQIFSQQPEELSHFTGQESWDQNVTQSSSFCQIHKGKGGFYTKSLNSKAFVLRELLLHKFKKKTKTILTFWF
jgi:hypothetical protein